MKNEIKVRPSKVAAKDDPKTETHSLPGNVNRLKLHSVKKSRFSSLNQRRGQVHVGTSLAAVMRELCRRNPGLIEHWDTETNQPVEVDNG